MVQHSGDCSQIKCILSTTLVTEITICYALEEVPMQSISCAIVIGNNSACDQCEINALQIFPTTSMRWTRVGVWVVTLQMSKACQLPHLSPLLFPASCPPLSSAPSRSLLAGVPTWLLFLNRHRLRAFFHVTKIWITRVMSSFRLIRRKSAKRAAQLTGPDVMPE